MNITKNAPPAAGANVLTVDGHKLNMDTLLAPEGGVHIAGPGDVDELDNIAPADDTELEGLEPEEQEEGGDELPDESAEEDEQQEEVPEGKGSKAAAAKAAKELPANAIAVQVQNALRSKFGPEVSIRTNGTREELVEDLQEFFTPNLSPEAMRLQQHIDNGGTVEGYFQQRGQTDTLLAISDDKELMKHIYQDKYGKSDKRPDGLTDERIIALLAKKEASGALDIEAIEAREKLRTDKARIEQENAQYAKGGQIDVTKPEEVARLHTNIEKSVAYVAKTVKVPGIDLSKAESVQDVTRLAKHYFTPDAKGITQYDRKMTGPGNLVKAMLLLHLYDSGALTTAFTEQANKGKMSVLKRLPTQPRPSSGGKSGKPGFNKESMLQPEGFTSSTKRQ